MTDPLKSFEFTHLTERQQPIASRFYDLAEEIVESLPAGKQKTGTLTALKVARDSAIISVNL